MHAGRAFLWPVLASVAVVSAMLAQAIPRSFGAPAIPIRTLAQGVSRDATAENSQRKLVADPRGRLFLAYVRQVGGIDQVVVAESDDRGLTWRHTQVTQSAHAARLPSLASLPDGTLHLVWTEYAPIGRVLHRRQRQGRWGEAAILSSPGVYAGIPVVAPVSGRAVVLWYGIRPGRPDVPTRHDAFYEILSASTVGERWTPPVVISPGPPDSLNPSLDVAVDGSLHAAWYQFDGRSYQVRYAAFTDRWSHPQTLTTGRVDHAAVALAAHGRDVHLVWEEGTERPRVMHTRLGGEQVRLSGEGSAHAPVIGAASGAVAAAWSENGAIVLRPLSPAGPPSVLGRGDRPMITVYQGVAFVAWTRPAAGPSFDIGFSAVRIR